MTKNKYSILVLVLLYMGCQPRHQTISETPIVRQGIKGKIVFREGNFLSSGEINNEGKVYAVEREIFIYSLTTMKEVDMAEGCFIKNVYTEKIDSSFSDERGEFFIPLNVGYYSVFVEENGRLYAKSGDKNNVCPIQIKKDSVTNLVVEIDYKATY